MKRRPTKRIAPTWLLLACVGLAAPTAADEPLAAENLTVRRIADGIQATKGNRGHVHPAVCVAHDGTVVVAHYAEAAKQIHVLRSTDGGRTFQAAGRVPDIGPGHPYPGALTTLADGRIVVTWNTWVAWPDIDRGRRPAFAVSDDSGRTWSPPEELPIEHHRDAWIRHRVLERSAGEWIFPMGDRVIAFDPVARKVTTPFPALDAFYGPLVRTDGGALQHGNGNRSTDDGRTWQKVPGFPPVAGYRNDLLPLDDGRLVAAVAKDNNTIWLNVSYDDGKSWTLSRKWVIYDPGHVIGNGCPQMARLDAEHLGVVFWDHDREQPGGPGVYFARLRLDELERRTKPD